jgi:oligopeptide/dipeptide ABC transporter ATP-binding protein
VSPILEVQNLSTHYFAFEGTIRALEQVSFGVEQGEVVGLVGVSGSGKSVLADSLVNVIKRPGKVIEGKVLFEGENLLSKSEEEMRIIRGKKIATIGANPRLELNPMLRVGDQLATAFMNYEKIGRSEAKTRAVNILARLGINDPKRRVNSYPHELSGGMAKRVIIAMALTSYPKLLIADEPGAGLDVTIQAQILELIRKLIRQEGMSALLITRDLGVVAHYCDRVGVLQKGRLVELAEVEHFFKGPQHAYSKSLLQAFTYSEIEPGNGGVDGASPRLTQTLRIDDSNEGSFSDNVLLRVVDLKKHFIIKDSTEPLVAVDGVSFEIRRGETLGLVGESGSGKTTVGRCILRLTDPTAGRILFEDAELTTLGPSELREVRPRIQMVFQDPYNSLNPRRLVRAIITEPLRLRGDKNRLDQLKRVVELAELVGLDKQYLDRYPHQLTSGEQQRVAIARAIALNPELIVLDEVTSALDPNARASIINLLKRLQREFGFAYLFISHDLSVVKELSSRVMIMYLGRIVELGTAEEVFSNPHHPYARALINSVLWPDPAQRGRVTVLHGEVPSPIHLPVGCYFASRCPLREPACEESYPQFRSTTPGHFAACFVAQREYGDKAKLYTGL